MRRLRDVPDAGRACGPFLVVTLPGVDDASDVAIDAALRGLGSPSAHGDPPTSTSSGHGARGRTAAGTSPTNPDPTRANAITLRPELIAPDGARVVVFFTDADGIDVVDEGDPRALATGYDRAWEAYRAGRGLSPVAYSPGDPLAVWVPPVDHPCRAASNRAIAVFGVDEYNAQATRLAATWRPGQPFPTRAYPTPLGVATALTPGLLDSASALLPQCPGGVAIPTATDADPLVLGWEEFVARCGDALTPTELSPTRWQLTRWVPALLA